MKNCKLYWISLATTMLFASGCGDLISTEEVPSNPPGTTACTNGTWKCDDNVLSKCIAGKWDKFKMCGNNAICNDKTGECTKMNGETKCRNTEHLFAGRCEADTLEHCGAHGNACNVENGTNICNKGKCDFECFDGFDKINGACEKNTGESFVSEWLVNPGTELCIPIGQRRDDIQICWGDGACETIPTSDTSEFICHTYSHSTGDYTTISITGSIQYWSCRHNDRTETCIRLHAIHNYGKVKFGNYAFYDSALEVIPTDKMPIFNDNSMKGAFAGCYRFDQDINFWDTSNITDMSEMFYDALSFNQPLNDWDTSNVTNMSWMFRNAKSFNQPLDKWNTSNVTNMKSMFAGAESFNQPLDNWNTSNVTNMSGMFGSSSFNYPLDKWDTSNVTDMSRMFYLAKSFNQPLNGWDISNVTNLSGMFQGAESFNGDIDNWNTANVKDMSYMFAVDTKYIEEWPYIVSAYTIFNKPINSWNTSNVTNMDGMFYFAHSFNQTLDKWDTSNVTNMSGMFSHAYSFNQPLNNWDISNVTNMNGMFSNAYSFNQPLNDWNTSNVTYMSLMFWGAYSFNQPLNDWNTSNVTYMRSMFYFAHSFNQPLDKWDTSNVIDMGSMFQGAENFNQPLDKWDISKVSNIFNIFDKSGMTRDNYCKLFKGEYGAYWKKWKNLGIYFNCD